MPSKMKGRSPDGTAERWNQEQGTVQFMFPFQGKLVNRASSFILKRGVCIYLMFGAVWCVYTLLSRYLSVCIHRHTHTDRHVLGVGMIHKVSCASDLMVS